MTEQEPARTTHWSTQKTKRRLARRHAAERRFRGFGIGAIGLAISALLLLAGSILWNGASAFLRSEIKVDIHFDPQQIGELVGKSPEEIDSILRKADFGAVLRDSLRAQFPDVKTRLEIRALQALVGSGSRTQLADYIAAHPEAIGKTVSIWIPADDEVDMFVKGKVARDVPEVDRRLKDNQVAWLDTMLSEGRTRTRFNTRFLSSGDSREPELAGVWGATVGSFLTLSITLAFAFPLGVGAAIYLEEFANQSRMTDLIEVNINNLAAVPSIVFGLLGLAFFLNTLNLPRSAPLVGGLTLALMTLPTIIIAGRAALKAVPPSIREGARGLGASPIQVVAHHVLPLAMPGILTGTIIGMARALGETAPLLMIGMVAFVVDIPGGFADASTALPVQVFLWADSPERAFVEKTSGATLVLLGFLVVMNAAAIYLRQRFETRW